MLAGLVLLFFAPLIVQPHGMLYADHSDFVAHYLPAKRFLIESWRMTGELPLWCPNSLGGMPFVHDPQVGAFYPPHWLLLLLPLDALGSDLSWLIVLHLLVAGWGAYACARDLGLDRAGSMVAGIGFLFAGKWLLHLLAAGHYTTIGLAWLPWALLCMQRATRERSLLWATGAGVCYALVILGTQPQWAFYAGILLALWTLCPREDFGFRISDFGFQVALGLWAALVAAALSAVQLLPALEAAAMSTRAGGVPSEDVLEGGLRALLFLVGPTLTTEPANLAWEDRGGFGLLWLIAAALAPILCRGRVRWQTVVCLALILFGIGGAALVQGLPGFRLFRQATRMLLIASLPVALLAGATTQALLRGDFDSERCRRVFVRVVVAAAILVGGFAARQVLQGNAIKLHVYWITILATIPVAYWLLGTQSVPNPRWTWHVLPTVLWIGALIVDLWAVTWPLVAVRAESDIYAPSACVEYLASKSENAGRVLDIDSGDDPSPLGRGAPLAMRHHLEAVRGYNPLDVGLYKEYLQRIAGDDTPLRPFEHPLASPIAGDFPINERALLDLLGVRFLLQLRDAPPPAPGWRKVFDDTAPAAFDVVAGGRRMLAPYSVYENKQALPRVFVVPQARGIDDLQEVDFRKVVLLEGDPPEGSGSPEPGYWSAKIAGYRPNCVTIDAAGTTPGWLVLADIWYPGWNCTVDGVPAEVARGDFLFRTIHLDAGRHEVVFRFEPGSYRVGKWVSLASLALVAGLLLAYPLGRAFYCQRAAVRSALI
jgi:hypothetical protein